VRRIEVLAINLKFTKKRFASLCTSLSDPCAVIIDHSEHPVFYIKVAKLNILSGKPKFKNLNCQFCLLTQFTEYTPPKVTHDVCSTERVGAVCCEGCMDTVAYGTLYLYGPTNLDR